MVPRTPLPADERLNWASSAPFLALHLLPLAMLWTGVPVRALVMAAVLYFGRMFFITAGYHRYFSHRSYRAGRPVQLLLAVGGTTALQRGPLWWAAHHRHHHRWSDTDRDVHSPIRGFWWSHVGWILCDRYGATDHDAVKDLAKFPELRWLDRHDWVAPLALAAATFVVGGWAGLVVGFGLSTVLLWHGTFLVNSLAHVIGRRRYLTTDTSRNSLLIALLTNGEGWHNNHHHYQASARQSFRWYQWDPSYYALWLLARAGLVHDLKTPSATILARDLAGPGRFDLGVFRARWEVASGRLAAFGTDVTDILTARRELLEARIEAARHGVDESIRAQRLALADLAAVRRAARSLRPLPTWA
jgi:stearoyl-CoA desaturase (delta-9 desaturase)